MSIIKNIFGFGFKNKNQELIYYLEDTTTKRILIRLLITLMGKYNINQNVVTRQIRKIKGVA